MLHRRAWTRTVSNVAYPKTANHEHEHPGTDVCQHYFAAKPDAPLTGAA